MGTAPNHPYTVMCAVWSHLPFRVLPATLDDHYHHCCFPFVQFALSSLLLGVLLLMNGGTDHLELQLETLDQEAFLTYVCSVVCSVVWCNVVSPIPQQKSTQQHLQQQAALLAAADACPENLVP